MPMSVTIVIEGLSAFERRIEISEETSMRYSADDLDFLVADAVLRAKAAAEADSGR